MADSFIVIAVCTVLSSALIALLVSVVSRSGQRPAGAEQLQVRLAVAEERASRFAELERSLAAKDTEIEQLRIAKAKLEEALAHGGERMEALRKEFALATSDASKTLGQSNREQLDVLLHPLREQLRMFESSLQQSHVTSTAGQLQLQEQMRELAAQAASWKSEADALKRALSSDTRVQGAWGEMVLSSILTRSGLREGEEFVVQQTQPGNDTGERLRPDVIVNLPGGERIVIDAKVSLTAFYDYIATGNTQALDGLRTSLRSHIRDLASKDYAAVAGSGLGFTMLFVPVEGAFAAAVSQADPELVDYAISQGITIVTPTTLVLALRTVHGLWQVERRNLHAEEIANRAGKLYDKFAGFIDDMKKVDERLRQARESYEAAYAKLAGGRGNLISQAESLRELGARTTKVVAAAPDANPQA